MTSRTLPERPGLAAGIEGQARGNKTLDTTAPARWDRGRRHERPSSLPAQLCPARAGHSSFYGKILGVSEGPRPDQLTWSRLRPVLVAALLVADGFVVAALGIARPPGWLPPFIAFGSVFCGLVAFLAWSLSHRDDG